MPGVVVWGPSPPPNTQPGTDWWVTDADTGVEVMFGSVTRAGITTMTASTTNPGPGLGAFEILGTFYDIATTATYTGPVTIGLPYDPPGPRPLQCCTWWMVPGSSCP